MEECNRMKNNESPKYTSHKIVAGLVVAGLVTLGAYGIRKANAEHTQRQNQEEQVRKVIEAKENQNRFNTIHNYENRWKSNYAESSSPIVGTVLEERSGMHIVKDVKRVDFSESGGYTGPLGGYHSVSVSGSKDVEFDKLSPVYVIKLQTDSYLDHGTNVPSHVISIDVKDGAGVSKEGLEALVVEGSKISFQRGNIDYDPSVRVSDDVGEMYSGSVAGIGYNYPGDTTTAWGHPKNRYGFSINNDTWFNPETQSGSKEAGRIRVISSPNQKEKKYD